jgi:hypothetical protein
MRRVERVLLACYAVALIGLMMSEGAAGVWLRLAGILGSAVAGSAFGVADHHIATYKGRPPEDSRMVWTLFGAPLCGIGAFLARGSGTPAIYLFAASIGLVLGSIWLDERR